MDSNANAGNAVSVGDEIKLTKSIWEDGDDHSPPGWLAMAGTVLVVRKLGKNGSIAVSHHNITNNSFWIDSAEYKMHQSLPSIISSMNNEQTTYPIDNETQILVNVALSFSPASLNPRVVISWQGEYLEPFKRYVKENADGDAQAGKYGFLRIVLDRTEKSIVDVKMLHLVVTDDVIQLNNAHEPAQASLSDIEVNTVLRFNKYGAPEVYVSWAGGDWPAGYGHHQPNLRFVMDGVTKQLRSVAIIEPKNNNIKTPLWPKIGH